MVSLQVRMDSARPEVALDQIDEFAVEIAVIDRVDERQRGENIGKKVITTARSLPSLSIPHRRRDVKNVWRSFGSYTTIITGSSISVLNAPMSSPSTARWSVESVTDIIQAASILPLFTIARSSPAPTARMVACGGLMTAAKSLIPYIPRFDTAVVPP